MDETIRLRLRFNYATKTFFPLFFLTLHRKKEGEQPKRCLRQNNCNRNPPLHPPIPFLLLSHPLFSLFSPPQNREIPTLFVSPPKLQLQNSTTIVLRTLLCEQKVVPFVWKSQRIKQEGGGVREHFSFYAFTSSCMGAEGAGTVLWE